MHVSPGFPARWNDKNIVKFDDSITSIKINKFYDDKVLMLKERNSEEIVETPHKEAQVSCDNGHLKWITLICPYKLASDHKEIRFSNQLEIMRKDVKFNFGILKQYQRMLNPGIRVKPIDAADKIFKTFITLQHFY